MRPTTPRRIAFTRLELLCVMAIVSLIVSLTTPAILSAKQAASQNMCRNNLKQIGLAMHNYHDVYNLFPPAWTNKHWAPGLEPGYGWQVRLLPYVDQAPMYDRLNIHKPSTPYTTFDNDLLLTPLDVYRCPIDPTPETNPYRGNLGTSNYSLNFGDTAPPRWATGSRTTFWPGQSATPRFATGAGYNNGSVRLRDFTDGMSNSLLAGERASFTGANIWPGVRDNQYEDDITTHCAPGNEINTGRYSFSSHHKGGANFLMGDGAVRFLSETVDSAKKHGERGTYQNLANRQDGQPVRIPRD